jgi:hypothetical protein
MPDTYGGLDATFAAMSDEELLERWNGGQLTDIAVEAARAELQRRGTPVSGYRSAESSTTGGVDDHGQRDFVVVERSLAPGDLQMLRARLEGDGIPSLIADGETNRMNPLWSIALGGTRLLVPRKFEETAREIIALVKAGAFTLGEDEILDDEP